LDVGPNAFSIAVTAEDNSYTTYPITVTREAQTQEPLSSNANLASLSVTGYSITPTFSASVITYTLTVPNTTSSITINATAADSKAKGVTGTGAKTLSVGSNTCSIVVTAEDNSNKTYTIAVTREAASGTTAVATAQTQPLQVYPNPVINGELIIQDEELKAGDKIEVYSLSGAKLKTFVATGAKTVIDLSALPAGGYVVRAGSRTAKVVKQ
ncbi:MAG: cadherin-like beta sandwich domain-containing protein, partial [Prevotellaceae bacterium]|jgi:hypothetical protein|nr:cadherin-like beta sandwich domain-containing protein [Prevotellaceae bacterium]